MKGEVIGKLLGVIILGFIFWLITNSWGITYILLLFLSAILEGFNKVVQAIERLK